MFPSNWNLNRNRLLGLSASLLAGGTYRELYIPWSGAQDYLLYAIPMLDFEPEFNVGLWTQFSLIQGSNLIFELESDDPIGQFNNVFWTSANDSISLSKKLTCWVLKGPTGQSSPGKATESRGVGVGVGGKNIYCFRINMNH